MKNIINESDLKNEDNEENQEKINDNLNNKKVVSKKEKIINNTKTKTLSKNFVSVEEMINKNIEIENKITSTELINFYFNALETTNQLLEKNKKTENNFKEITDIMNNFKEEVKILTEVTDKHRDANNDKRTIDAYKESWENMNSFVKTLLSKLNAVTISANNIGNIENKIQKNDTDNSSFIAIAIIVTIIVVIGIIVKKIFF